MVRRRAAAAAAVVVAAVVPRFEMTIIDDDNLLDIEPRFAVFVPKTDTLFQHLEPHITRSRINIDELAFFVDGVKVEDIREGQIDTYVRKPNSDEFILRCMRKIGSAMLAMKVRAADEAAVRLLIRAGARIDKGTDTTPLHAAAEMSTPAMLRVLADATRGQKVDYDCVIDKNFFFLRLSKNELTPLLVALETGCCEEMAMLLYENGASLTRKKLKNGESTLVVAAYRGWARVVGACLRKGMDVSQRWDGKNVQAWARAGKLEAASTALGRARRDEYEATIQLLIAAERAALEARRRQREKEDDEQQ